MEIASRLTRAELASLHSGASAAIWRSHALANRLTKGVAREEDYVAALVTDSTRFLVGRWSEILDARKIALRVSGVFCHGHPQVEFGTARQRVELADLLVVHQHWDSRARMSARATLVQAKMASQLTYRLPASDPQLELYSNWPRFEFVSGGLSPGLRNIREVGRGTRYALVLDAAGFPEDIAWPDQCPWAACRAQQELAAEQSLAKLLVDMLLGKDGRPVGLQMPRGDWSRTIKELLVITARRTYTRKNLGRFGVPRGTSARTHDAYVLNFTQSELYDADQLRSGENHKHEGLFANIPLSDNSAPPEREDSRVSDDPGGGISTLLVETKDRSEAEQIPERSNSLRNKRPDA